MLYINNEIFQLCTDLNKKVYLLTDVPPPVTWPEFGEIVFDAVSLRYDGSLDPVVHDLSIHIPAARKVTN